MNKRYYVLFFSLLCFGIANAQRPSTYQSDEDRKPGGFNVNRIFVGGSLNLGFSSYTFQVGGVPEIGYSITDWLDAGIGININYQSERADPYWNNNIRYRTLTYGGGPFVRVYPIHFLFVQGQFEHNWLRQKARNMGTGVDFPDFSATSNSLIAGVGYTQRVIGQSSFYTMIGMDLMNDTYSPYRDYNGRIYPIIRAGFNFYLKPSRK